MVDPIDVKRKGRASIGFRENYVTFTFDLTHALGIFQGQISNNCISGIVGVIGVKQKEVNQLDAGLTIWPCPLPTPMTLTLKFQGQSLPHLRSGRAV